MPWWRVEPEPGRFDLGWLDEVAGTMDELGLTCAVDLVHYGTPDWLPGSFTDRRYPEAVEGARRTVRAIRAADPAAGVLHVEAGFRWEGAWPVGTALLDEWRFLATDLILGRPPTPLLAGYLRSNGLSAQRVVGVLAGGVTPDVLGFNYYPGFTTQRWVGQGERPEPVEAGTQGLAELARAFDVRYGIPLALTETSRISADPADKIAWLGDVLATLSGELADVDIRAASWFPFMDMVDWDYREGAGRVDDFMLPFGLVSLARQADGDLRRVPTAALAASRVAAAQGAAPITPPSAPHRSS